VGSNLASSALEEWVGAVFFYIGAFDALEGGARCSLGAMRAFC
jgi:hypothetical protein